MRMTKKKKKALEAEAKKFLMAIMLCADYYPYFSEDDNDDVAIAITEAMDNVVSKLLSSPIFKGVEPEENPAIVFEKCKAIIEYSNAK